MESRILNFPDGMKLAIILHRYDVLSLIDSNALMQDFVNEFFQKVSVEDLSEILSLALKDYTNAPPTQLLEALVNSFTENRLADLLEAHRGLKK